MSDGVPDSAADPAVPAEPQTPEAQTPEDQTPEAQTPEVQRTEAQRTEAQKTEAQKTEVDTPEPQTPGTEVPDVCDGSDQAGESITGPAAAAASEDAADVDPGEAIFYEAGGSWLAVWIGPILVVVLLILEIVGGGRIHWQVLVAFGVMLAGFGYVQKAAAERHVSVLLTETTLREGAQSVALADIAKIFPENHGGDYQKWESARALGELPAVPRRRKGIGVELVDGTLRQAWARDVERFRTELTEAHLAVKMGLEPKKNS